MRVGFKYLIFLLVPFVFGCSIGEEKTPLDIMPEEAFLLETPLIVSFDYSDLNEKNNLKAIYNSFKDLKIWEELGAGFYMASLVDEVDKNIGNGGFDTLFMPIIDSGFRVSIALDELNFESFVVSLKTKESDSFKNLLSMYLSKKFEKELKMATDGLYRYWEVEKEKLFFVNYGDVFVFSNNKILLKEAVDTIKKHNGFKLTVEGAPFLSVFSQYKPESLGKFQLAFFAEEAGIRGIGMGGKGPRGLKLSFMEKVPSEGNFMYLEGKNFKNVFDLFGLNYVDDLKNEFKIEEESFYSLLGGRFAVALNYVNKIPGAIFYLDVENDKTGGAEKMVEYFDGFLDEVIRSFDKEILASGKDLGAGVIKKEKLEDGNGRVFVDFSLLSGEMVSQVSSVLNLIGDELKVELNYGILNGKTLFFALYPDFSKALYNQVLSDSSYYSYAKSKVSFVEAQDLFYMNFVSLWDFFKDYFEIAFKLGNIDKEQVDQYSLIREALDKFQFLIAGSELRDEYIYYEIFLGFNMK